MIDFNGKRNLRQSNHEDVVLGGTRRATAAGGGQEQKDASDNCSTCSIIKDTEVKNEQATAQAMEYKIIPAMQALKNARGTGKQFAS